jgi:hypothetical protein
MTENTPQTTLVSKLILVVLSLIFCCLLYLVYQSYQTPHPAKPQPVASEEAIPAPGPAAAAESVTPISASRPATTPPAPARPPVAANAPAVVGQADSTSPKPAPPKASDSRPVPAATLPPTQAATGIAAPVTPAAVLRYQALPTGSEMKLEGDSTAHKWTCIGKIIMGGFEVEAAWQTDRTLKSVACLGPGATPPKCEVKMPVRTLKSQVAVGATIMDSRMQAEMDAKNYPMIEYTLTEMTIKGYMATRDSIVIFDTAGLLVVRGKTNQVHFPVTMERIGTDRLKFVGGYETTMSALGVKPPEFTVMGVGMKAHDPIKLTWTWLVGLVGDTATR